MKTVIQDNGGYAMYAQVEKIELSKDNEYVLKFSTTFDQSRDPTSERTVAQFVMRHTELAALQDLIKCSILLK